MNKQLIDWTELKVGDLISVTEIGFPTWEVVSIIGANITAKRIDSGQIAKHTIMSSFWKYDSVEGEGK